MKKTILAIMLLAMGFFQLSSASADFSVDSLSDQNIVAVVQHITGDILPSADASFVSEQLGDMGTGAIDMSEEVMNTPVGTFIYLKVAIALITLFLGLLLGFLYYTKK